MHTEQGRLPNHMHHLIMRLPFYVYKSVLLLKGNLKGNIQIIL